MGETVLLRHVSVGKEVGFECLSRREMLWLLTALRRGTRRGKGMQRDRKSVV